MYAFAISAVPKKKLKVLSKYFTVIDAIDYRQLAEFPEALYWKKLSCSPLVAVNYSGVFNRPADKLCAAQPSSAVSRNGDVDPSLMVLDPRNPSKSFSGEINFARSINKQITNWKPMTTDSSVEDYDNEYIGFWLQYATPTFIHFDDETFNRAANGNEAASKSKDLYLFFRQIVDAAKKEHPGFSAQTKKKK
jgi:hypothetical protein